MIIKDKQPTKYSSLEETKQHGTTLLQWFDAPWGIRKLWEAGEALLRNELLILDAHLDKFK